MVHHEATTPGEVLLLEEASFWAPHRARMANKGGPAPFLRKTWEIVSDPSTDSIISWSTHGSSFVVWRPAEFARDILPAHFKHCNFSSFVRQLNTYGFRKVDPDRWEFANEGFRRDKRDLMMSIVRRKPATATGPAGAQSTPTAGAGSSAPNPLLQDSLMTDGMLPMQPNQHLPQLNAIPGPGALPPGALESRMGGVMHPGSYPLLPMPFPLDITSGLMNSCSSELPHIPAPAPAQHPPPAGTAAAGPSDPRSVPQQPTLPQPPPLITNPPPTQAGPPGGLFNSASARTSALLDAVAMAQGNLLHPVVPPSTLQQGGNVSAGQKAPPAQPTGLAAPPPLPPAQGAAGQQPTLDAQSRLQNMLTEYFKPGSQVLASIGQDAGQGDVTMQPRDGLSRGNSSRFVTWQPPGSGSTTLQQQVKQEAAQQQGGGGGSGSGAASGGAGQWSGGVAWPQQDGSEWAGSSAVAGVEVVRKAPSGDSPAGVLDTPLGSGSTSSGVNAPLPTRSNDQGVDIDEYLKTSKRRRDKLYINKREQGAVSKQEPERGGSPGDGDGGGEGSRGDDMEGVVVQTQQAVVGTGPTCRGSGTATAAAAAGAGAGASLPAARSAAGANPQPLRPTAQSMPQLTQNILAEMAVQLNKLAALATEVEGLKEENQQLRMSMDVLRQTQPSGGPGVRNSGSDEPHSGPHHVVVEQPHPGAPTPTTSKSLSGSAGAVVNPLVEVRQASSGGTTGGTVDGAHNNQHHTSGSSERADNNPVVTPQLEAMLMEQHERFWAMKLRNDQVELQMAAQMQQTQQQQERTAALEAQLAMQIQASVDTVELAKTLQERLAAQYRSTLEADARSRDLEARLKAQETENAAQRHMQAAMQAKIHALEEQVAGDALPWQQRQQDQPAQQQQHQQAAGFHQQQQAQPQGSTGSTTLPARRADNKPTTSLMPDG